VLVRMSLSLAERLEAEAARSGASLSDTVARLVEDALGARRAR
jgi:predicted HicB family RNase H-like nuclease